jgi:hypothetical protein
MASSIAKKNQAALNRATKALERTLAQIQREVFPSALEKVGEIAVKHSKDTHTYKNVTGDLERSHAHKVAAQGETVQLIFEDMDRSDVESFTSPKDELHLLFYAGKQYGLYVERTHGFDVMIQSFLMLRRQFVKIFSDAIKLRRIG